MIVLEKDVVKEKTLATLNSGSLNITEKKFWLKG